MQYVNYFLIVSGLNHFARKPGLEKAIYCQLWKNKSKAIKIAKKRFKDKQIYKKPIRTIERSEKYILSLKFLTYI